MQDLSASSAADFDFFMGRWSVRHRRLRQRLVGCHDWDTFHGTCHAWKLMDGQGNVDDNWLDLPGEPYRAATLRAYDAKTRQWAIWWLDGRSPAHLGVPMRGGFSDGVGLFLADDTLDGRPIRVRFQWSRITPRSARWEQAFWTNGGASWETNWEMDFERVE